MLKINLRGLSTVNFDTVNIIFSSINVNFGTVNVNFGQTQYSRFKVSLRFKVLLISDKLLRFLVFLIRSSYFWSSELSSKVFKLIMQSL